LRTFKRARKVIEVSPRYAGEPVTLMAAQDVAYVKAWGDVTVDLLKRLDMKVDFAALDWGTVIARIPQKSPPGQGGCPADSTEPVCTARVRCWPKAAPIRPNRNGSAY
jgi:hypothetical protein